MGLDLGVMPFCISWEAGVDDVCADRDCIGTAIVKSPILEDLLLSYNAMREHS
jgi:hypothetical protein